MNQPTLDRSLDLVTFLRKGCDWDAAQTPRSLQPYLIEEAHECADAIARDDDASLKSELGDLLLNVAFQIVLAEERGAFTRDEVVAGLEAKMRRRHPHLYGDGEKEPWEVMKAKERKSEAPSGSLLDGLPTGIDPLLRAQRMQERVAAVGFDWPGPNDALDKVREETAEVAAELAKATLNQAALESELGDLLFSAVNVARLSGTHALMALQGANDNFEKRFRKLESLAQERGLILSDMGLEALDALWLEAKALLRNG